MSLYPKMSREQRRAHYRKYKNNPNAIYCKKCTHKTIHVAMPSQNADGSASHVPSNLDADEKKKIACDIVCTACGEVLKYKVTGLVPYEVVKEVTK